MKAHQNTQSAGSCQDNSLSLKEAQAFIHFHEKQHRHTTRQRSALRKWVTRTAWLMGFAVAGLLIYASSAQAAVVCTEVTRPDGTSGLACKNVPDQSGRSPGVAKPKPIPILVPPPAEAPPVTAKPDPKPAPKPRPTPPSQEASPPVAPPSSAQPAVPTVMRQDLDQAMAQAAALVLLTPTVMGSTTLNLSAAHYRGQSAIGITFAHRPTSHTFISLGASAGTQQPARTLVRISAGMQF